MLTIPLAVGLVVLAVPLVAFLYPDRYRPAASALAFLAILGGIRVLLDFAYDLFVAVGRSRTLLVLQCLWGVALIPTLIIGAETDGIREYAIGHVVVAYAVVVPAYYFVISRSGIHGRSLLRSLARPTVAGLAGALSAALVVHIVGRGPAGLVAGGLTLLVVYLLLAMRLRHYRRFASGVLDFAGEE